jgi:hypothetical protein
MEVVLVMSWFLSYVTSTFGLISVTGLLVVICLGIAWTLKSLKWAIGAAAVLAAGLAYAQIDHNAFQRAEAARAQAQIELLQTRILTISMITAKDNERSVADAFLNTKLKDLSLETPRNDGACLDAATAHRVWAISGTSTITAPLSPGRVSNVLPWRLKRP